MIFIPINHLEGQGFLRKLKLVLKNARNELRCLRRNKDLVLMFKLVPLNATQVKVVVDSTNQEVDLRNNQDDHGALRLQNTAL